MDIRQLRYFIAIANAKSYSIAAKSLFVTQPTLTWTIQKLETDLNTKLFYHSERVIELTENGKLLYEYGKNIVKEIDDLTRVIRGNENTVNGKLKVGLTVLFSILYMQSIAEFISSHSNIEITLIQKGSKRIQEMVSSGELDLGLVSFPIYYDNLEVEPFITPLPPYNVSVVVSKDNPLASRKSLKIKDLKEEAFSVLSTDFILGNLIFDRCNEVGFEPHVIFSNENWEVLLENVAITNSITLLPTEFSNTAARKDVKWIQLEDKINQIDIGLVKRKKEKLSQPNLLFCQAIKQRNGLSKK
ncbi:LysR family transcriptional regulator [Neobacillus sp. PS3-40]|jgi:DNA-binding transcriptional LysR family regulator|uniref:LysR family transcriptional regulator n=1 Tax=Neobacillus sp. PS3-40 TaxID=3070679 RepID=UPI0027DF9696|nr:LysR family transcriptional regulator [Neobacillus sp. PS3-40]WML44703.1 LysR family transcriptional regulator [Neobacillus sp. PS3-40]